MRQRPCRAAFTLVELLIALLLTSILMLATWATLDLYTSSFERGEAYVEEAQIVRSVVQLLTDDLQAAIQDPGNRFIPQERGAGQIRRFGLNGTATRLQVDVLQMNPFDPTQTTAAVDLVLPPTAVGRPRDTGQAPELKTVYYTFVAPSASSNYSGREKPGLTRRELAFEAPAVAAQPAGSQTAWGGPSATTPPGDQTLSVAEMLIQNPDAAETWAPEVVDLRFRYFDGRSWQNSWNSVDRRGLPVAIEATLRISSLAEVEQQRWNARPRRVASERRVVIHLPGSPLQAAPATPRPPVTTAPTTPRPPQQRAVEQPRYQPPRPTQPATPSEGWIRTGS